MQYNSPETAFLLAGASQEILSEVASFFFHVYLFIVKSKQTMNLPFLSLIWPRLLIATKNHLLDLFIF